MVSDAADPSADLLRRWKVESDPDALNELLKIEVGILKHMIHGKVASGLSSSASTSDIAQEAVMGLLNTKKSPTFTDPKALRGYLWRSAWHLLVKRYEKTQKGPSRLECELEESAGFDRFLQHAPGLQNIDRAERAMAISLAMNLLSHEDRELIRQVYFEETDTATAAAKIGLNRTAGAMRLVRARRLLAERLAEWADLIS